jgi:hypothetical protein
MSDDKKKKDSGFTAPYVSWGSFKNLIDRMTEQGLPMRIDRSYLSNMAGSTQSHLLKALKELELIDDGNHPTEALKSLVANPESQSERIGTLVEKYYAEAITLGNGATQSMLEEKFSDSYNVSGSTRRKSIAFFLAAAKFGEVAVSQHFKTPKRTRSTAKKPPTAKRKGAARQDETPPPPSGADDPKKAYVDLLLKKAADDMENTDLLDRIERVIGLDPQTPSKTSPKASGGGSDS